MPTSHLVDQAWYQRFYGARPDSDLVVPPEIVRRYFDVRHPELFHLERLHQRVGDVRGKKCLYLGCGVETSTVLLALKGADMWPLDLAVPALRRQALMALANGTDAHTHPVASSCEALPFPDAFFDVVIGLGILHHLQDDLDTPCSEIARVLKADGHAVFTEPINRSRLLRLVRPWLPISRPIDASPQCRPLPGAMLQTLTRHFRMEADFYGFLSRLSRFLSRGGQTLEGAPRWKQWTLYALHYLDYLVLRLPFLASLGSVAVFDLRHLPDEPTSAHRAREG